tara:strand:- start:393 stop:1766 length:1374 start_codon:yes stop_codon:yes gene_type:complete
MNKRIFSSLIFCFIFVNIIAQEDPKKCGITPLMKYEMRTNSQYKNIIENYFNGLEEWTRSNPISKNTVITIPVVVHVVHKQSHNLGIGTNIPQNQIDDAIKILNEDYRKSNSEFPNPPRSTFIQYAGDCQLEFCLATTDENGNTTSGVTRTSTAKTSFDADDNTDSNAMKRTATGGKDGWDPLKYLNIWVVNLMNSQGGQTLGYSFLPGLQSQSWTAWKDGLVVDYAYFGTVGNAANSSQNDGRTPTHEIGHYLGLKHTFCEQVDAQGNPICCDNDNTSNGGYVDDTPATEDIYWGNVNAGTQNNTCDDTQYLNAFTSDVLDMDENYMSYSFTTWMFSNKQINVMDYTMNASTGQGGRAALKTSNGCMISGINDILHENLVSVYPNPTDRKINFKFAMNIKVNSIIIQNVLGEQVVKAENIQNDIFSMDLSTLPKGIYFATLDTKKGRRIEKIILSN